MRLRSRTKALSIQKFPSMPVAPQKVCQFLLGPSVKTLKSLLLKNNENRSIFGMLSKIRLISISSFLFVGITAVFMYEEGVHGGGGGRGAT